MTRPITIIAGSLVAALLLSLATPALAEPGEGALFMKCNAVERTTAAATICKTAGDFYNKLSAESHDDPERLALLAFMLGYCREREGRADMVLGKDARGVKNLDMAIELYLFAIKTSHSQMVIDGATQGADRVDPQHNFSH